MTKPHYKFVFFFRQENQTTVIYLFFRIGPSQVPRRVISVDADPVQTMPFWSRAQVGFYPPNEILRIMPILDNFYMPTSIIRKSFVGGIVTTLHHLSPTTIQVMVRHSMGGSGLYA
jgi:hypothetical protein